MSSLRQGDGKGAVHGRIIHEKYRSKAESRHVSRRQEGASPRHSQNKGLRSEKGNVQERISVPRCSRLDRGGVWLIEKDGEGEEL